MRMIFSVQPTSGSLNEYDDPYQKAYEQLTDGRADGLEKLSLVKGLLNSLKLYLY